MTRSKARNVLLLSLILDDEEGANDESHWNIYYHFHIDEKSLDLLRTQARKLHSLSSSLSAWHEAEYGGHIRFCDSKSLEKVRDMWALYSTDRDDDAQALFEKQFRQGIKRSKAHNCLGEEASNYTAIRSAIPAQMDALKDLPGRCEHYWTHGFTNTGASALATPTRPNPAFASPESHVFLHYGTDPLLGFHLAAAYLPLGHGRRNVVKTARTEFYQWASAFRTHFHRGVVTLRLFVGDALAFSYCLQHKGNTRSKPTDSVHWYRDRFHFEPLTLDGQDYAAGGTAPLVFHVIDSSNLIDHLGALNLLTALSPLLRGDDPAATLYTEKLVLQEDTHRDLAENLLCGPLLTVSMLLGLAPAEFVTNSSPLSLGDEMLFTASIPKEEANAMSSKQLFTRISWKRPLAAAPSNASSSAVVHFEPDGLAHLLYQIYLKMFEGEDISSLTSNPTMANVRKLSLPTNQRASFVAFLRLVQSRVPANGWDETITRLFDRIAANNSLMIGRNYIQELYLWLHLLGVHSAEVLQRSPESPPGDRKFDDLRDWKGIPPFVCVTLEVPRSSIAFLTEKRSQYGALPLQCSIESSSESSVPWQNLFAAIQTGFGKIVTKGPKNTANFEIEVIEDQAAWGGRSPMVVSFLAPAWMLLLEPWAATVAFGVQTTPNNVMTLNSKLGIGLYIFQTALGNSKHVYISKDMPNQRGYPMAVHSPPGTHHVRREDGAIETAITTSTDSKTGRVVSFTNRVQLRDEAMKEILGRDYEVEVTCLTPFNFAASVGGDKLKLDFNFPAPVLEAGIKTRIARKSSYIEIVARAAKSTDLPALSSFLYPVTRSGDLPVVWNLPYVRLPRQPILDMSQKSRLGWLNAHLVMVLSAREKALRKDTSLPASPMERARMEMKVSIYSIMMGFSGLQHGPSYAFGISCPGDQGVHLVVFVSSLRFDHASRSVLLDGAVLQFRREIMHRIEPFLQAVRDDPELVRHVSVTDEELRLWKTALPAWTERCRSWSHKPGCEYVARGKIPVSVESAERVLCSCGEGRLPKNFVPQMPAWKSAARYSVRVAISPPFSAAIAGDVLTDTKEMRKGGTGVQHPGDGCWVCGQRESGDGGALLRCAACREAQYCSPDCQKKDWKKHKADCSKAEK